MIDYINGTVEEIGLDYLVISSNGIGYHINSSTNSLNEYELYEENIVYTKLIVKEDDISLVGFSSREEREMYNLLITVSKIGMKTALAMLSMYRVKDIAYYIKNKDIVAISKVPGYGKKTSERLVLELQDKVDEFYIPKMVNEYDSGDTITNISLSEKENEAMEALKSLGFTKREAETSVKKATDTNQEESDVSNIIKLALTYLKR